MQASKQAITAEIDPEGTIDEPDGSPDWIS
jgi:hypothetical protein